MLQRKGESVKTHGVRRVDIPVPAGIQCESVDIPDPSSLRIVKYPNPVLAQVCARIERPDEKLRALTERMFAIMYAAGGVGLAAPQVGLPIRLFVANPTGEPGQQERVYVNPKIVAQSGSITNDEGCLSLPGVVCKIKRHTHVTVRAEDVGGNQFQQTGEDLLARIFQHELDHLNGILIADKMSMVARLANRRAIRDLQQQYADGQSDRSQAGA